MKRFLFIISLLSLSVVVKAQARETVINEISARYLDTLIYLAKSNYARSKIYDVQIGSAEYNVKKAKASWLDALSFSYLYSPRNTTTLINPSLLNGYQFGIGINIGNLFQKPSDIKIARNDLEIAWLQKDEYMVTLETTVKERYYKYVQQLSVLKLTSRSELDASGILQSVKNKFEKGEETFESYSRALMTYTSQSQVKMASETDLLIAKARLEEVIGVKLEALYNGIYKLY